MSGSIDSKNSALAIANFRVLDLVEFTFGSGLKLTDQNQRHFSRAILTAFSWREGMAGNLYLVLLWYHLAASHYPAAQINYPSNLVRVCFCFGKTTELAS